MRVRVAAIVMDDGQVLLVSTRRGRPGFLVPPGGGVEEGEGLAEAVAREVREEAGLEVGVGRLLAYRELLTPKGACLELYFSAQLSAASTPLASAEERTIRWVTPAELATRPHFPEQLGTLLQMAGRDEGAVFLGQADLREESRT